jgi:hypothetical protein
VAFGLVSFSLTMCLLEAISNDIEELGIVDPPAVLTIMVMYILGLCFIFLAAHAEVVFVATGDKSLSVFTVLSSLGLFFAVLFQALIERKLLDVFSRAKHRYPAQYQRKLKAAVALRLAVLVSLAIALIKSVAKVNAHGEWVAYLVALDLVVVVFAVSISGVHRCPAPDRNPFESRLERQGA